MGYTYYMIEVVLVETSLGWDVFHIIYGGNITYVMLESSADSCIISTKFATKIQLILICRTKTFAFFSIGHRKTISSSYTHALYSASGSAAL